MRAMAMCLRGGCTDTVSLSLPMAKKKKKKRQLTRCLATRPIPSVHRTVPPPLDLISLNKGITRSACSPLSRKCVKKSPSLCQLSKVRKSNGSSGLYSGFPRLMIHESRQPLHQSVTRSSPPTSSQIASHALGAKSFTSTTVWPGMLTLSVFQVDLSVGEMPRRAQMEAVQLSASCLVKH